MDIYTMELSAFLFFVILIPLTASETLTKNIGLFLSSIYIRFLKYILHGQEQKVLVPNNNNSNSILQREKLYEFTPKDTLDNGSPIPETSKSPIQDFSSTKNYSTNDTPTAGFTITSGSTETDDPSSGTSKDFVKLLQKPETSWDSFTKGLENPVTLTGSSKNEHRNQSVVEIPVAAQSVCDMVTKIPDRLGNGENLAKKVVQCSLDGLESSIVDISTCPCPTTETLQVGTDHTELVGAHQTCDIEVKLSDKMGHSSHNASSRVPVTLRGLSENGPHNYSVLEKLVGTQSVGAMEGKVPEGEIFTIAKSEEVVHFSVDVLESSVKAISTCPCPVTEGTDDDSLQVGTNHTELDDAYPTYDIKKKLSVEVGYSSQNSSSRVPVTFAGLSENEPLNHSFMDTPVPVCATTRKMSDDVIFTIKSEEVVQFSVDGLESSIVDISTLSCPVTTVTKDDSLQVGTNHTELVVGTCQTCEIKENLSVEEGYSCHNASSRDMTPKLISEDASENKCETGNIIKEREIYENSPIKRSSLSTVPIEFIYPCLPYFNS